MKIRGRIYDLHGGRLAYTGGMRGHIQLVRAIGSEFVGRKMRSIALPVGIGAGIALAIALWLTTLNVWWWLLAGVVLAAVLLLVMVYLTATYIANIFRPALTTTQRNGVRSFVDKLERVTEVVGTPMFVIILLTTRDIIWHRQPRYIQTMITDSTSLHKDLQQLQKLFTP